MKNFPYHKIKLFGSDKNERVLADKKKNDILSQLESNQNNFKDPFKFEQLPVKFFLRDK